MKRVSFKERLLAVLMAAVMLIGCSQAVFAAPSESDIQKALNINDLFIFNEDNEKCGKTLTYNSTLKTKLSYFINQYPNAKLHKIFGVSGVDSDGTRVKVRDYAIQNKATLFQYDKETQSWKKLSKSKSQDLISFTVKTSEPIIITDNAPKAFKQKVLKINGKSKLSLELAPGKGQQITVTDADNDFWLNTAKKTFKSSNTSVARVSKNGYVSARKNGSATITVKVGNKTATCSLKVVTKVTKVSLKKSTLSLSYKKNRSATLKATVSPKSASNKKLKWTSSNKSVAKVSSNGRVTVQKNAKAGATATITATAKDGSGKSATCTVKVV